LKKFEVRNRPKFKEVSTNNFAHGCNVVDIKCVASIVSVNRNAVGLALISVGVTDQYVRL
jgi:hypothetical protein